MRHKPYLTMGLLAAVVIVFIFQWQNPSIADKYALLSGAVREGEWYRIFTGALLHGGPVHLLANVWAGWGIGSVIEGEIGFMRMLVISLAAVIVGGIIVVAMGSNVIGLSGVLYGWLASWLAFHFTSRFPSLNLSGPRAMAYLQLLAINIAISFLPGISFLGHAGGFVGGFLGALAVGIGRPRQSE